MSMCAECAFLNVCTVVSTRLSLLVQYTISMDTCRQVRQAAILIHYMHNEYSI